LKKTLILTIALILCLSVFGIAQEKFAFVNSQKILADFQEAIEVQNKLEEIRNQYEAEYQKMVQNYQTLAEEIESQSLLLSEEKKQEKLRDAQQKAMEIDKYKYDKLGPEGELYRKNLEFTKPIYDKINKVIQTIGEEEEIDFIFDASQGALLWALPKYEITDRIIAELNKGVSLETK
jgi:outer membrane protein